MHSSTVTSSSLSRVQKSDVKYLISNSSTNAPRKSQINNKENLAKRTLKFKKVNNNVIVNSPNQSPCVSSPSSKKRVCLVLNYCVYNFVTQHFFLQTSIKILNEKFKRRSKHKIFVKGTPLITKLEAQKETNSSQTDGNESGICAGASTASSSNDIEQKFTVPKICIDNISDVGMVEDENFDYDELEFKDNDFISSTLLLES